MRKRIIYERRGSTICVRVPDYLKRFLEAYAKKYHATQADIIICLLIKLNIEEDITNDK